MARDPTIGMCRREPAILDRLADGSVDLVSAGWSARDTIQPEFSRLIKPEPNDLPYELLAVWRLKVLPWLDGFHIASSR